MMVTVTREIAQTIDGQPLAPGIKRIQQGTRKDGTPIYRYHDGVCLISDNQALNRTLRYHEQEDSQQQSRQRELERIIARTKAREEWMICNPFAVSSSTVNGKACPPWITLEMFARQSNGAEIRRYKDAANNLWISSGDALTFAEEWARSKEPPTPIAILDEDGDCICDNCGDSDCTDGTLCRCDPCPCIEAKRDLCACEDNGGDHAEHIAQSTLDRQEDDTPPISEFINHTMRSVGSTLFGTVSTMTPDALSAIPEDKALGLESASYHLGNGTYACVTADRVQIVDDGYTVTLTLAQFEILQLIHPARLFA